MTEQEARDEEREAMALSLWDEGLVRPESLAFAVVDAFIAAGYRKHPGPEVTDEMVADALDARAAMSRFHCYLYATEKCRCGAEWSDAHWMRYLLEAALRVPVGEGEQ